MTTVTLKGGVMAADWQAGEDYGAYPKIHRLTGGKWAGGWAAFCGESIYSAMALLQEIQKDEPERRIAEDDDTLLVVPLNGRPFTITWSMTPVPVPPGPFAIGSGAAAAMGAMVAGASAERAVLIACRLDNQTGLAGKTKPLVVRLHQSPTRS